MAKQRNVAISVAKGIAIILMVVGHAEAPELVTNVIYTFHMPLFFITAGYFFSQSNAEHPWEFCGRRFRGLYIPFLKWSLVFLLLHNLWFHLGILNETYGNWTGGVTHPYGPREFASRLLMIVTSMSGYDEFMAGAFWFFRGLLVASILFMVVYRLIDIHTRLKGTRAAVAVCLFFMIAIAYRISWGLKISTIPNGGLREMWGVVFFGLGMIFRNVEHRLPRRDSWIIPLGLLLMVAAGWMHLSGMNNVGKLRDLLTLPLTGCIGFLTVYLISKRIAVKKTVVTELLAWLGDNSLYIFIFHIVAFKPVSALKIWVENLDPAMIGCHMVIHENHTDIFWVIYSVAGVALPAVSLLAIRVLRRRISRRRAMTESRRAC